MEIDPPSTLLSSYNSYVCGACFVSIDAKFHFLWQVGFGLPPGCLLGVSWVSSERLLGVS